MKSGFFFRPLRRTAVGVATLAAFFLTGTASAQQPQRGKGAPAAAQILIRGTVVAQHPALTISGFKYTTWQRTEHPDTAVTDASGQFTLRVAPPADWTKGIARGRGVMLGVYQPEDSACFSVLDRIYVSSLPLDTSVTVELYPRVLLPDGSLPAAFKAPRFSAGDIRRFLANELQYPEKAREEGIQGTVVVRFLVNDQGALGRPEIVRGLAGGCSEEVQRVVRKMPAWIPGELDGKPAAMVYYLPLKFTLE